MLVQATQSASRVLLNEVAVFQSNPTGGALVGLLTQ